MRRVRVDGDGELRCWHCGGRSFRDRRTLKGAVAFGFLASKKLKCHVCGQWNQGGHAAPHRGPSSRQVPPA